MVIDPCIPEYCKSRVLVLGCGNILLGDDGFGPVVVQHLKSHYALPDDVCVLDVGTGVRDVLLTVALSPVKPQKMIVIDVADRGGVAGQVFAEPIEDIPQSQKANLLLHHIPTSSLLKELKDYFQTDVQVITVQPQSIPEAIAPGLSQKLQTIVASVCDYVMTFLTRKNGSE